MDYLTRRGPTETKALKLATAHAQPKHRAQFDRSIKELQEKFLALKVEERYDPFTYVWDTVDHRWGDALRAARDLTPRKAAEQLVRRYFAVAGFANERALARLLGIDIDLVSGAARRLEAEGLLVRQRRVPGLRETISHLAVHA
jgi:hypothetical protein